MPRSNAELLDREIVRVSNMKKRHKNVEGEAVNRVNKHKQDLKNKILQANLDASDFSEVETVNAAG